MEVSNLKGISYPFQKELENLAQIEVSLSSSMEGWSKCFLRKNIERKVSLALISYINWRYYNWTVHRIQMFNNYKYYCYRTNIIRTPLDQIIRVYSFIFLSNQTFLCSTIITFNSAWIIYKQFRRSCGIFGSNQSVIIIFYPPSVSRSSSTSLIFHSTRRPFPSTFVEYSPGRWTFSVYLLK